MAVLSDFDLSVSQYVCALSSNEGLDSKRKDLANKLKELDGEDKFQNCNIVFDYILEYVSKKAVIEDKVEFIRDEYELLGLEAGLDEFDLYVPLIKIIVLNNSDSDDRFIFKSRGEQLMAIKEVGNSAAEFSISRIRNDMYIMTLRLLIQYNLLMEDIGYTNDINKIVLSISNRDEVKGLPGFFYRNY